MTEDRAVDGASRRHDDDDVVRIMRTRDDTRRGAATRGTATRDDTLPSAATEQLSERRGRESVPPHHTCRATAAAVATPPTTAPVPLGRTRLPSSPRVPERLRSGRRACRRPTPRAPNFKSVKDALSSRSRCSASVV